MKKLVLESIETPEGDRCVDILHLGTGYGFRECRRDPEDSFGWRALYGGAPTLYPDEAEARAAAQEAAPWLVR